MLVETSKVKLGKSLTVVNKCGGISGGVCVVSVILLSLLKGNLRATCGYKLSVPVFFDNPNDDNS